MKIGRRYILYYVSGPVCLGFGIYGLSYDFGKEVPMFFLFLSAVVLLAIPLLKKAYPAFCTIGDEGFIFHEIFREFKVPYSKIKTVWITSVISVVFTKSLNVRFYTLLHVNFEDKHAMDEALRQNCKMKPVHK